MGFGQALRKDLQAEETMINVALDLFVPVKEASGEPEVPSSSQL